MLEFETSIDEDSESTPEEWESEITEGEDSYSNED